MSQTNTFSPADGFPYCSTTPEGGRQQKNKSEWRITMNSKKMSYLQFIGTLLFTSALLTGCGQTPDAAMNNQIPDSIIISASLAKPTTIPISCITPLPDNSPENFTIENPRTFMTASQHFTVSREMVNELSYKHGEFPQLYARYQGTLSVAQSPSFNYIVDLIQLDASADNMMLYIQISGSENFYQEICITFDFFWLNPSEGIRIIDLNNDQNDDFIIDLGDHFSGKECNAFFFVFDSEHNQYNLLGNLCDATFYKEEGVIYSFHISNAYSVMYKYSIENSSLVLLETIHIAYPVNVDDLPYPCYTQKKLINGELITVLENVSENEIDLSDFAKHDRNNRVK